MEGPRRPREAPEGPGRPRKVPEGPGRPRKAPEGPRRTQKVPEDPRRPRKVLEGPGRPRARSEPAAPGVHGRGPPPGLQRRPGRFREPDKRSAFCSIRKGENQRSPNVGGQNREQKKDYVQPSRGAVQRRGSENDSCLPMGTAPPGGLGEAHGPGSGLRPFVRTGRCAPLSSCLRAG